MEADRDGFPLPNALTKFKELLRSTLTRESIGKNTILSSPALRATHTALRFASYANEGGYGLTVVNCLNQKDNPLISDFEDIFLKVEENKTDDIDTLVIVTHGEFTGGLLDYLTDRWNNAEIKQDYTTGRSIDKGQMIIYDFEKDTEQTVGP